MSTFDGRGCQLLRGTTRRLSNLRSCAHRTTNKKKESVCSTARRTMRLFQICYRIIVGQDGKKRERSSSTTT
jgi:hypothetical protein